MEEFKRVSILFKDKVPLVLNKENFAAYQWLSYN